MNICHGHFWSLFECITKVSESLLLLWYLSCFAVYIYALESLMNIGCPLELAARGHVQRRSRECHIIGVQHAQRHSPCPPLRNHPWKVVLYSFMARLAFVTVLAFVIFLAHCSLVGFCLFLGVRNYTELFRWPLRSGSYCGLSPFHHGGDN